MPIVQTVLSTIDSDLLGRTLTHEHLCLDFENFYIDPPENFQSFLEQKISLENLGYVRQYPYSSMDNLRFYDEDTRTAVLKDVELYKKFGGSSIVENTTHGLKRDLEFLVKTSQETGVHIIAGTGHYVHSLQKEDHLKMTSEEMVELYTKEILTGVEVDGIGIVKCGFIGEVGSTYPIDEFEIRAIAATAAVQETLKCGVSFHPGRNYNAPFEIVRMYLEAGGKANKCVMSHLDRTFDDVEQMFEFAELGTFMQYDLFGTECSSYQLNARIDMPSDAKRINNLIKLIREGLEHRILISHDIHTKHRLTSFGGHGYHHINMNVLPRMLAKGLTNKQMEQITISNPAKWLEISI